MLKPGSQAPELVVETLESETWRLSEHIPEILH